MGKRETFQAVLGVLSAFLFLISPAAARAGEAKAPEAAPVAVAQAPGPAAPESAPAAPPEAAPTPPPAAEAAPPEAAPAAPPEAAPAAPPEASPAAPPGAAAPEAAPAAPPEAAPGPAAPESAPAATPGAAPPAAEAAPSQAAPAAAEAAPAAPGAAPGAAEYPNGLVHTVVQGDTLWDLSAKYLGSPWRWTELWERNRFLTNPHYIYPGIRVVIFPPPPKEYEMAGKEPGPETEAAPAVAPPPPATEEAVPEVAEAAPAPPPEAARILDITESDYVRAGEFFETRPRGIGRILGGMDVRVIFSEGEKVVLSLNKEIPAGQLLGVYRVRGPVRGPAGRRVSGYVKHLVGLVQVLGRENGAVVGRIRKSFEELTRRDIITEEIPGYAPVVIDPGREGVEASVITGRRENTGLAQGDFIYLDRGANDGIARGNVFRLFRKASDSPYLIEVGKAIAVRVLPKSTTLYVVNSTQSFEAGVIAKRGDVPAL